MVRAVIERADGDEDIAAGRQFHGGCSVGVRHVVAFVSSMIGDVHFQPLRHVGDLPADAAKAKDAEALFAHQRNRCAQVQPFAGHHAGMQLRDTFHRRHHQGDGMIRHRGGIERRSVRQGEAATAHFRHVETVVAGALADDDLQICHGIQHRHADTLGTERVYGAHVL